MEGFLFYICIYFAEINLELWTAFIVVRWDADASQGGVLWHNFIYRPTHFSLFNSMPIAALDGGMGADAGWSLIEAPWVFPRIWGWWGLLCSLFPRLGGAAGDCKTLSCQDGTNEHKCSLPQGARTLPRTRKPSKGEKLGKKMINGYRSCQGLWCVHDSICYGKVTWRTELMVNPVRLSSSNSTWNLFKTFETKQSCTFL